MAKHFKVSEKMKANIIILLVLILFQSACQRKSELNQDKLNNGEGLHSRIIEDNNKAVITRWWDEMYAEHRFDELMTQLAGPEYIRHGPAGKKTVTIEEHLQLVKEIYGEGEDVSKPTFSYELIADGDKVAGYGRPSGLP